MEDCDHKHLNVSNVAYPFQCFDSWSTTSKTPGTCDQQV